MIKPVKTAFVKFEDIAHHPVYAAKIAKLWWLDVNVRKIRIYLVWQIHVLVIQVAYNVYLKFVIKIVGKEIIVVWIDKFKWEKQKMSKLVFRWFHKLA